MLNSFQNPGQNARQNTENQDRTAAITERDQQRRTGQRIHSDQVLALAEHLQPAERFLIQQVFEHGLKLSDIALQQGKSRSCVHYHVKQLLKRIGSPLFRFLIAHEDVLPRPVWATGKCIILEGRTLRETARRRRISLHTVRQHLQTIQSLARL